jgi:hypothetical protein
MAVVDSCHGKCPNCSGNIVVIHTFGNAASDNLRAGFLAFTWVAHLPAKTAAQYEEAQAHLIFHSQWRTQVIATIEKSAIIVGFPDSHQEQISSKQLDTS